MTLSYYFYKEHWKLFLENSFQCGDKCKYIEDMIVMNTQISNMALKYYGIVCDPVLSDKQLTFEEDEIYFIKNQCKGLPFYYENRGGRGPLFFDLWEESEWVFS